MVKLEILHAGLLTTIQDMGRPGLAYYAIPSSGVMDKNAARIAQLLLHQPTTAPLIECTALAPKIKFHHATQVAIAGANFGWMLNDTPIASNSVIDIRADDILHGKIAREGFRAYIAIKGQLQLPKVYNSYATYTNAQIGGYEGRMLKKGDLLEWKQADKRFGGDKHFPLLPGPEFDLLAPIAQQLLRDITYTIGNDSNRMGLRLRGTKLECTSYQLEHSLPVLPGFIQLPPSGLPLVILQDGQLSGGYPRIAYLQSHHLSALNQIPLGGNIHFRLYQPY